MVRFPMNHKLHKLKLIAPMKKTIVFIIPNLLFIMAFSQPIYQSKAYSIYNDKVVQGTAEAKAVSATQITSNYQSPANQFQSSKLAFKFSINGKDNEMKPGVDHHFNVTGSSTETPVIRFGMPLLDASGEANSFLQPDTKLKIKVDMKPVFAAFKTQGFYTTFNGDKIYKEDFKGLYVAGGTLPMIWDFDNLVNRPELQLKDDDGDGIFETTIILNAKKDEKQTAAEWIMSKDIAAFPQYKSDYLISDAIYNMSVEEMIRAVEPDSTFRTGKEWAGVWTRDISYSIILSMAYLQPEVAKKSLLRKVNKKKRIIQDTGTGGAYPCSTDRMIWAVAAFEVYKATGDKDWLQQAFEIVKNSIDDDMLNAYDAATGLVKGESSFLDWREQTYPKWMQPVDIYESENLGTNAVHYQANIVLSQMAAILKNQSAVTKYLANAGKIKAGINKYLWMEDKGYYAQFYYGRNSKMISPKSEALGEALCVLFDIADAKQQQSIIAKMPVTDYGIPCIYPQIPGITPYHNNAVWPFVQSYWAMASAKTGNETSVMESLAAIWRPAALFLTNKENFVADNGDFAGTVINSSNMLWSLSGNLAMVHKVIFGIEFKAEKLLFHPFVPQQLKGNRSLKNFKYRNTVLNIEMEGFGNRIQSFLLDGKLVANAEISDKLTGTHSVKIILASDVLHAAKINKLANYTALVTPLLSSEGNIISWQKIDDGVKAYTVFKNGKQLLSTPKNSLAVNANSYAAYQVIAVDADGVESFASEPLIVVDKKLIQEFEVEKTIAKSDLSYKGFTGSGFVEINNTVNRVINIPVDIKVAGTYAIDFRYANGNGPINTKNMCAIRTLKLNNAFAGTIVLPQRGTNEWSNWGYSNAVQIPLIKGKQIITLSYESANENMNEDINQAMLDLMRVIKIK
jgi:Bacterial alpha-L-rhamnosidase 6 hairpin glycosidase domain